MVIGRMTSFSSSVRTRPGAVKPMSAVPVADGSGQVRTLVVSNSWLEAMGLVTSAEDLKGCVTAASATGANGYPVALSALLGLDPSDPAAQVRFDGIGVSDEVVGLSLRAGGRALAAGCAVRAAGEVRVGG